MDRSSGMRAMHTFKKLPSSRPKTSANPLTQSYSNGSINRNLVGRTGFVPPVYPSAPHGKEWRRPPHNRLQTPVNRPPAVHLPWPDVEKGEQDNNSRSKCRAAANDPESHLDADAAHKEYSRNFLNRAPTLSIPTPRDIADIFPDDATSEPKTEGDGPTR